MFGIHKLQKIVGLDGISSLDEARTLATTKVQLNPAQTICEYIRSELLTQSEYSVRCIQGEPEGGKHWKNCIYEDSFGDIVMDIAKYNFALIDAPNDNDQLQKGYIFAKA